MNEEHQRHLDLAARHLRKAVHHLVRVPKAHNAALMAVKLVMLVRRLGASFKT